MAIDTASFSVGEREAACKIPTLVLMAGFAGAGKTTLAYYLREQLGWEVLNKDQLKLK